MHQLLKRLKGEQFSTSIEQSEEKTDVREYVETNKVTAENGVAFLAIFYDRYAAEQYLQLWDLLPIKP